MTFLDTALVVLIITFIVLMIWSKLQQQRMLDTLNEIRDFVRGIKE
jgi:hypothetical protein